MYSPPCVPFRDTIVHRQWGWYSCARSGSQVHIRGCDNYAHRRCRSCRRCFRRNGAIRRWNRIIVVSTIIVVTHDEVSKARGSGRHSLISSVIVGRQSYIPSRDNWTHSLSCFLIKIVQWVHVICTLGPNPFFENSFLQQQKTEILGKKPAKVLWKNVFW